MPTGKIKWFDVERGFGFIGADDGTEVFLHANQLADTSLTPKAGMKVEFSVADGRKGPQAMAVQIVSKSPSVAKNRRRKAQEMVPLVEDLIKLLDSSSNSLRRGHYPDNGRKIATLLRAVAEDFDA
ncbi:MAG: cold shock domain-containing protein [Varibaculum sp.]|nr:cold shock domain-containing protein [Varibaculum sp.]